MIKLYKDLRIKSNIVSVVILILYLFLVFFFGDPLIIFIGFIAYAAALLINNIIFTVIANMRHKKLLNILSEQCDPYAFLESYMKLLDRKVNAVVRTNLMLNIAAGYIDAGDFVQGEAVLNDIDKNQSNSTVIALIYSIWAVLLINKQDIAGAQRALADMRAQAENSKMNSVDAANVNKRYNVLSANINIELGYLDGAEQLLGDALAQAECMMEKVSINCLLAQLYKKQGRKEEAKQAYLFASVNGNKLYIAEKAREELENL